MKMNVAYLASVFCFSLGVQATSGVSQHGSRQAASHKLRENGAFLQVDGAAKGTRGAPIWPWLEKAHHPSTRLMCGITEKVGSHTDKYEDCPSNCPYFAQNRKDADQCTFLCVPGAECGRWNPNKPIPDSIKKSKTCRGPKVAFCSEPSLDGSDTCQNCQSGFALFKGDGQCYFKHWTVIIVISVIVTFLLTIAAFWVVDMCCREAINSDAVTKTEAFRSRSKIIDRSQGTTYDTFSTNMCEKPVAGPGMLLHFRFQLFFIVWPLCCAILWTVLACFHNELFILGTRKFGTPRHNCILVAWGYETQQRLMWTKVLFLAVVYVASFVSFLWFSVSQLRKYQAINADEKSMKDFALELKGLPPLPGDRPELEKDIQKAVENATGKSLVGVSIAWNYHEQAESVDRACIKDLAWRDVQWEKQQEVVKSLKESKPSITQQELQEALKAQGPTQQDVDKAVLEEQQKITIFEPTDDMSTMHKWMYNQEKSILGPDDDEEEDVKALLEKLVSSDSAFIVFNTEEDKVAAFEAMTPFEFDATKYGDGCGKVMLSLEPVLNEPGNLNWHNFRGQGGYEMTLGFLKGFFQVYVPALLIWFFGFYCPYAWSLYTFNYDNGAELPGYYSIIFTIVVCGGNATMYVVCDICCDCIGFRLKDTKQVCYMLMYLVACMINVFLDMIVTYFTAYKVMVGLDFRTYHGVRLSEIDTFTEQFETYAMQRSLGENTYRYAWPSTFFLCFVLEPIVTILVPYQLGKVIIRTHKEIRGTCAEAYLAAFEFDLGRYADILLNVFLGILIFYFPGGYIWTLFYFMCGSHMFIYCFDHWRVLNVIPYVKIVSMEVDWYAQLAMGACCAVILSCLVFKSNCETYSGYCVQDMALISRCCIAGVAHFIVHTLLLIFVVPKFGQEYPDQNEGLTFESAAATESRTWFSSNPVHCLRSKYIHNDAPHCRLAAFGKEHLLETNAKIGCHFFTEAALAEEFDVRKSISSLTQKFSKKEVE